MWFRWAGSTTNHIIPFYALGGSELKSTGRHSSDEGGCANSHWVIMMKESRKENARTFFLQTEPTFQWGSPCDLHIETAWIWRGCVGKKEPLRSSLTSQGCSKKIQKSSQIAAFQAATWLHFTRCLFWLQLCDFIYIHTHLIPSHNCFDFQTLFLQTLLPPRNDPSPCISLCNCKALVLSAGRWFQFRFNEFNQKTNGSFQLSWRMVDTANTKACIKIENP